MTEQGGEPTGEPRTWYRTVVRIGARQLGEEEVLPTGSSSRAGGRECEIQLRTRFILEC